MEKIVEIDGNPVKFKATAALPRLYRTLFGRDIFQDMAPIIERFQSMAGSNGNATEILKNIHVNDMAVLEDLTFAMAKAGDPSLPYLDTGEWMDQYSFNSMSQAQQEAITLWIMDNYTLEKTKKK